MSNAATAYAQAPLLERPNFPLAPNSSLHVNSQQQYGFAYPAQQQIQYPPQIDNSVLQTNNGGTSVN